MCRFPANRKHSSYSKPILISATSMRHDRCLLTPNLPLCDFNPHTFMRGATVSELLGKETIDTFHPTRLRVQARRRPVIRVALTHLFQSTRLVGGATHARRQARGSIRFQPTRLVGGATWSASPGAQCNCHFNPRARGRRDKARERRDKSSINFNPRASWEARQRYLRKKFASKLFQPTRLVGGATPP